MKNDLLGYLHTLMEFDSNDQHKTIFQIKKEYPEYFWTVWNEIKAKKLEYKKPNELYIGIIGTRQRDSAIDWLITHDTFTNYCFGEEREIVIVSGLCTKGGDKFAVTIYKKFETKKLWFPAQWELFGHEAGFLRNTDIAIVSDVLIAVRDHSQAGGAEDTIGKFIRHKQSDKNLILI